MEIGQDFKEFIQLLNKYQVQYLVVGGYAVAFHGYPRYTGDIDFWIRPEKENALKMENVLNEFGFGDLEINRKDFEEENQVIQLGFPPNRIDLLTGISGLNFQDSYQSKTKVEFEGVEINFISLHHLRLNKNSTGRDIDLNDLKNLPKE